MKETPSFAGDSIRAADDDHAFERSIAPLSSQAFFADFWAKSHCFIHRDDPSFYRSLFSLEDVDRWMISGGNGDGGRASQISIIPPPSSDRTALEGAVGDFSRHLLYQRFDLGDTVRLLHIEKHWPAAALLAARWGESFSGKVRINAYLTPASSQGFGVHFDYHDAFILQVAGAKEWSVYEPEPEYPLPIEREYAKIRNSTPGEENSLQLREQARLVAGDILYVPRGFYHRALTTDRYSLHLTVAIYPTYWVDFVTRGLELLSLERPELRRALPPGFATRPDEAYPAMSATWNALLDLVGKEISFERTFRSQVASDVASCEVPADGHFAALVHLPELHLESAVEHRAGMISRTESSGELSSIVFGRNRIEAPLAALPALEFIRDHKRFRVDELPEELSDASKIVLVRRLIREGLLRART